MATNGRPMNNGANGQGRPSDHDDRDAALERELAALKNEFERLKEEKVRTEQNLANLRQQLDDLRRKAADEYGTFDPEALERLLAEKRAENARLVQEYREHIASIRRGLDEVEQGS